LFRQFKVKPAPDDRRHMQMALWGFPAASTDANHQVLNHRKDGRRQVAELPIKRPILSQQTNHVFTWNAISIVATAYGNNLFPS
jgi:hypothetical protein